MTTDLTFETLKTEDWQRLQTMRLEMLRRHPDLFDGVCETEERRTQADWARVIEELHPTACVADGKDVAIAGFVWPLAGDPAIARIGSVYVRPGHRRRGIGAALLAHLLARVAVETDASEVMITAKPFNGPAQSLIHSLGFAPCPPERAQARPGSVAFVRDRRP